MCYSIASVSCSWFSGHESCGILALWSMWNPHSHALEPLDSQGSPRKLTLESQLKSKIRLRCWNGVVGVGGGGGRGDRLTLPPSHSPLPGEGWTPQVPEGWEAWAWIITEGLDYYLAVTPRAHQWSQWQGALGGPCCVRGVYTQHLTHTISFNL